MTERVLDCDWCHERNVFDLQIQVMILNHATPYFFCSFDCLSRWCLYWDGVNYHDAAEYFTQV